MLEIRNLEFPVEAAPKYWHGGRRAVSIFFDNLSIFFPTGERFFIASVVAFRSRIDDPTLKKDVVGFCGQEGIHGREHQKLNDAIARHGYPVAAMEGRVKRLLKFVARVLPKKRQLAVTCALEHFTAMLAHFVLSDARIMEGADPNMVALWRWHSAEENEHKAVAFDVYRAVGGGEAARLWMMFLTTLVFWGKVAEQQVRMMSSDGCLWSLSEWRDLLGFLFVAPGGLRKVAGHYFDYYRLGFHPWDFDNRDLLEQWKAELPAE